MAQVHQHCEGSLDGGECSSRGHSIAIPTIQFATAWLYMLLPAVVSSCEPWAVSGSPFETDLPLLPGDFCKQCRCEE